MMERKIICLDGELKGAEIIMQKEEQIVIGREPRFANLVFFDRTISRKHCIIELDEHDEYYVTDFSECGLQTENGICFEYGVKTNCRYGEVLLIGKAGTKIMLY